jgi:hypothetical protein
MWKAVATMTAMLLAGEAMAQTVTNTETFPSGRTTTSRTTSDSAGNQTTVTTETRPGYLPMGSGSGRTTTSETRRDSAGNQTTVTTGTRPSYQPMGRSGYNPMGR